MTAVVDASYAVAVLWEEADDDLEQAFAEPAIVPPLFLAETASAALKKIRRGLLSPDEARAGLRDLADAVIVTHSVSADYAFEVALGTGLTVYDATYLACAQALHLPLWTLDARLRDAAAAARVYVLP